MVNVIHMSNTTIMFGIIALFAVGMIFSSPITALAVPQQQPADYLDLEKTVVKIKQDPTTKTNSITDIIYKLGGFVPDETVDPFGYGVVTEVQTETGPELNVIATTSHAGILDADAQQDDENNPVLHNHYAILGNNPACGTNPSIEALTEEEIGQVIVNGKTVIVKDLPPSSTDVEITPGTNIQFVASFLLEVEGSPMSPIVCVNPVEIQNDRAVIFGEEEMKPDYPSPGYENHDGYGNEYDYANEQSYDQRYDYNQRY